MLSLKIPPTDSFLFTFLYVLTCSKTEAARELENNFHFSGIVITQRSILKGLNLLFHCSTIFYSRLDATASDVLHQYNQDNVFLLHILYIAFITSSKPTKLINNLHYHESTTSKK